MKKSKEIKAWAIVLPDGSLITPAAYDYASAIYLRKKNAEDLAESWSESSGREYRVVEVNITKK